MTSASPARMISLDMLRGLTVGGMILVNTAGGVALGLGAPPIAILEHSPWAGLTFADVVFPSFLMIMGVSTVFSLSRQRQAGLTMSAARQIAERSLRLFVLGFALTNLVWLADFTAAPWRLFGVLQRIALVYGICSALYLAVPQRGRLVLTVAILLLYWPLCLQPSLNHVPTDIWQRGMNFVSSTDRWMLGAAGHNYVKGPYGYDPEGLLSTLPCIAHGLIGIAVGEYLLQVRGAAAVRGLLKAAAGMIVAGLAWGIVFPIVKDIWTSSFVLLTCGFTTAALALAHSALDGPGVRGRLARTLLGLTLPFGMNAILIYVLHDVLTPILSWQAMQLPYMVLSPILGAQVAATIPSLVFIAMLWLIANYMAHQRWLVKI
ncbi:DUF1624 domain-containing protein [Sphingobium sp. LMC3-1-1.1]|uniref:acyltransferase family protein n=1 Tax=Sphingobium sp. LMC3-1-1.1 TaxID=3135241 RepID=UPI003424E382